MDVSQATGTMRLWYRKPASQWIEALPVGNGRLGAMVHGGIEEEILQLNEDTLWSGGPSDTGNNDALHHLADMRRLVLEEHDYQAADELALRMQGPYTQAYQPLGNLHIHTQHAAQASDYRRTLELETAVATVRYRVGEASFVREIFSSVVDDVLVIRFACDKPGMISLKASLDTPHPFTLAAPGQDRISVRGRSPQQSDPHYYQTGSPPIVYDEREDGEGTRFEGQVRAILEGGQVSVDERHTLVIEGADVVTF